MIACPFFPLAWSSSASFGEVAEGFSCARMFTVIRSGNRAKINLRVLTSHLLHSAGCLHARPKRPGRAARPAEPRFQRPGKEALPVRVKPLEAEPHWKERTSD